MSDEKVLSLDEEMEALAAKMKAKSPKAACPVERKAREACTSCEG